MFPEPTELLLIGHLFDRINLDPKIQIEYIDTKNQLADIMTKGNSALDEWNHLLCLFNISHFSSTNCSEVMSKRTHEDAGEDRVTAKSKPMMNLVSRCRERTPDMLAFYWIRKSGENQIWKSTTSELMEWASSKSRESCFGRLLIKLLWVECSQELVFSRVEIWWIDWSKNRETCLWTTTQFVHRARGQIYCWWRWRGLWHQRRFRHVVIVQIILAQVNDRLRKILDHSSKDAMQDIDKHSLIW